jgi:hypothetical protein
MKYIHASVGRCNREEKCGYHYKPKQYFDDNKMESAPLLHRISHLVKIPMPTSYISEQMVSKTLGNYANNNFVKFLEQRYNPEEVIRAVNNYLIGTTSYFNGATIFWQRDIDQNFRTGKIMLYNPDTCKRIKTAINWVHSIEKLPRFNLKQSFFGEHLLLDNSNPIGVVESEKNAIIASIHFPELLWLATGSKSNLSVEKCRFLVGSDVTLFPDYGAYDEWSLVAQKLDFSMSSFIEEYAIENQKELGFDIGDFIIEVYQPTI